MNGKTGKVGESAILEAKKREKKRSTQNIKYCREVKKKGP